MDFKALINTFQCFTRPGMGSREDSVVCVFPRSQVMEIKGRFGKEQKKSDFSSFVVQSRRAGGVGSGALGGGLLAAAVALLQAEQTGK